MKGEGNQQDYGMRVYDPRLGRFLSVDPLTREYPWNSSYSFAENEPIRNIDLEGAEKLSATNKPYILKLIPTLNTKEAKELLEEVERLGRSTLRREATKALIKTVAVRAVTQSPFLLFTCLVFAPANYDDAGSSSKKHPIIASDDPLILVTDDPSKLPNFYYKEVEARIKDGTAVVQDYLYQDEILRRKRDNDNGAVGDNKKSHF
ncbi:hypothetical protein COR50_14240 [Chitinophaga caeni]|uniref:RHS repeat-associated core domain-containing protein n=1 Tax=Chitinophaga caeni TaxID=2029983 RepID=A0A291QW18_9BACT|nr:hypothetical protein COR50_14240 [Chitinophaga caeni]